LVIKYDKRPTEFWRLEDDATGRDVAFQPKLPERGESLSQVVTLPPGMYTLHFTDTAGDGICCGDGKGNIVIYTDVDGKVGAEAPAVVARNRVDIVLAHSDGRFEYHLSLPLVAAPGLDEYTTAENSGNRGNLVAILAGVAVLSVTVLW
jgi:hypothetical protein